MRNDITLDCDRCGNANSFSVEENADETQTVACASCGQPLATVGQIHAQMAQEAIGLGATELRDDHVPVDGELGERPGI